LGQYVVAGIAGLVIAGICFMTPLPWLAPLGLLPLAWVFVLSRLSRIGNSYRLYGDRIEMESGIVGRKIENIELFRIRDVGLRQGLFGRLGDYGDVYVHSTDSSTPDLHLKGIDSPREFYQEVRARITASRAQGRTMIMEQGSYNPEP
jgi:uncharacterized membrane protein YdbT with pleckstrin-like domain